jgi:hypothetical protein
MQIHLNVHRPLRLSERTSQDASGGIRRRKPRGKALEVKGLSCAKTQRQSGAPCGGTRKSPSVVGGKELSDEGQG